MVIAKRDFSMLSEMNELVIQTKGHGMASCKCFRIASQKYLR